MQVLINLLKNAYEAIDMLTDKASSELCIQTAFLEGQVVIAITESGIGIEPEKAGEIFEYGKSDKGSSGFGLYYCKIFLENNGGTLRMSSQGMGTGSTFTSILIVSQTIPLFFSGLSAKHPPK